MNVAKTPKRKTIEELELDIKGLEKWLECQEKANHPLGYGKYYMIKGSRDFLKSEIKRLQKELKVS